MLKSLGIDKAYIWFPDGMVKAGEAVMALFRKEIYLSEIPAEVMVRVSADARYRLCVNGQDVCCGPCKGDRFVRYYERVDLSTYLKPGSNVISARVIRYDAEPGKNNTSVFQGMKPFFMLEEEAKENERIGIRADETWKVKKVEDFAFLPEFDRQVFLYSCEKMNGAKFPHGWDSAGFDDSSWVNARAFRDWDAVGWIFLQTMEERPIPLLPEIPARFAGIKRIEESCYTKDKWEELVGGTLPEGLLLKPGSTHIVEITAGVEETGYYTVSFAEGSGSKVRILCAETYWKKREDGTLYHDDREDSENGFLDGYSDEYVVGGKGCAEIPEIYSPFWIRTFRFIRLEIQVGEVPLKLLDFSYRETGYPLEVKTEIATSDPAINRIYELCLRTLKRCMLETYVDCPYYEQLQYAMDTRAQMLFTYSISADDRMARRTLDDFHRSLRPDGTLECSCPTIKSNVIPGFSCFYIYMLYDHMMYFGDKELLERYLPTVESVLAYFDRNRLDNGLVGKTGGYLFEEQYWSFIDWAPEWKIGVPNAIETGALTMESLLYLLALQYTEKITSYIGRTDLKKYYHEKELLLSDAIRRCCFDEEKQLFTDGPGYTKDYSEQTQVFAILTGLADQEKAADLLQRTSFVDGVAQCTVAMSLYRFEAYRIAGLYDTHSEKLWEPWKQMLKNNMTTCQENPGDESRSECHAWGATALYEIPSVILGLRPTSPGYQTAEIDVNPAFLEWAKGTMVTPKGPVKISVQRNGNDTQIAVDSEGFQGLLTVNQR